MKAEKTTEEIVRLLEKRHAPIIKEIEVSYSRLMRNIGKNLGLGSGDTEECINDAILEVWNTIPPQKPRSIRSYVCMLMRRCVIDRIRYNSAEKRGNTVFAEATEELEAGMDLENTVIDGICIPEILNEFLRRQTARNREIFLRRYFEFESSKAIARDLLMSANTIDKRLSRMRNELREMLRKGGYFNG